MNNKVLAPEGCNSWEEEPHLRGNPDYVAKVGYNNEGWLNQYSLGCGYIEQLNRDGYSLTLWLEDCYHVRLHDFIAGWGVNGSNSVMRISVSEDGRICWESFDDVWEARKFFADLVTLSEAGESK